MTDGHILRTINGTVNVSQVSNIKSQTSNPDPKNPMQFKQAVYTSTVFHTKSSIERFLSNVQNIKLSASASVSSTIDFTNATASIGAEYAQTVQQEYTAYSESSQDVTSSDFSSTDFTIPPGGTLTFYTVTTRAPDYTNSYDTNVTPPPDSNFVLNYTITVNYDKVVENFLDVVAASSSWEGTDADEWRQLYDNAVAAKNSSSAIEALNNFISSCSKLWTDGLDQGSWSQVVDAMNKADAADMPFDKLVLVFQGFVHVTDPSHNSDAWGAIRSFCETFLETYNSFSADTEGT